MAENLKGDLPVAAKWWDMSPAGDGVTMLREPYVDPFIRCNVWHVRGRSRDLVVDTGLGIASLVGAVDTLLGHDVVAVATHWHYDHVGGLHEFTNRAIHRSEAELVDREMWAPLTRDGFGPAADLIDAGGEPLPEVLVTAVPRAGWSPDGFVQNAAPCTTLLDEGDVVDLGDRHFEVLHLPGHSGGSIGLFEPSTGVLFSGDAIYDGPLLDQFPDSDIEAYCATMHRLRELPVTVVHGGHENDFGRQRLIELCDAYLVANE